MKTEKVLFVVAVISVLLKSFHVPGSSIFLILSLLTLTLLYFPFGFYFLSDKTFKENTLTSIIYGWLLSVCFVGIMFRIMHWPGSVVMNFVGFITAIPLCIFAYYKYKNADEQNSKYYFNLIIRSGILFTLCFIFTFFSLPI